MKSALIQYCMELSGELFSLVIELPKHSVGHRSDCPLISSRVYTRKGLAASGSGKHVHVALDPGFDHSRGQTLPKGCRGKRRLALETFALRSEEIGVRVLPFGFSGQSCSVSSSLLFVDTKLLSSLFFV